MKVVISTLHVRPRYNPSQEVYVSGLLQGMAGRIPREMNITVLVTSENRALFPLAPFNVVECSAPLSASRRILWEQYALPGLLHKLDADVYHGTGNMYLFRHRGPQAVTVHLAMEFHVTGGLRHNIQVAWRKWIINKTVRSVGAVICASDYLKQGLVRIHRPCRDEHIHVIPMGVDTDLFTPNPVDSHHDRDVLQRLNIEQPYFFAYADVLGLKNVPRIIEAWTAFRDQNPAHRACRLVLMGDPASLGFLEPQLASPGSARDMISFTGFVKRTELATLYRNARALIFPSLAESFGLCIIEAMACGTPVLTGNITAMPEVAGGAALIVDPCETVQIQNGMATLFTDNEQREKLTTAGIKRARDLPWSSTAAATLSLYEKLAQTS